MRRGLRGGGLEPPGTSSAASGSKICHCFGLGPTIHSYKPDGNFSIGCNDSFRYHPSNYLVCVSRLSSERNKIIMASTPEKLLSFTNPYIHHPAYEHIGHHCTPWRNDRPNPLDKGIIWTSNNTPFISCVIAYNLGYREIVLWGVDFIDHPSIRDDEDKSLDRAKLDFTQLSEAFAKNNCGLYLGSSGSALKLPLWKQ